MNLHFNKLRRITGGRAAEALVCQKVPTKLVYRMGLTFKNPLGWLPVWIRREASTR